MTPFPLAPAADAAAAAPWPLTDVTDGLALLRQAVRHLAAQCADSDSPVPGLVVTGADLARPSLADAASRLRPRLLAGSPLARLADLAGLDDVDVGLLLAAAAPDIDPWFETGFARLHGDATRRRCSVAAALVLAGCRVDDVDGRERLDRLAWRGMLKVAEEERPALSRALVVPDRVVRYLLGRPSVPDPQLIRMLRSPAPATGIDVDPVLSAMRGSRLLHLRESLPSTGRAAAAAAFAARCLAVLDVDAHQLPDDVDAVEALAVEARLSCAGVVVGPVEALANAGREELLRRLTELDVPVVLVGTQRWDPQWSAQVPCEIALDAPSRVLRSAWWRDAGAGDVPHEVLAVALGPESVARAVRVARSVTRNEDGSLSAADLLAGVRAQDAAGMDRLARRITPAVEWDDLVVPPRTRHLLEQLAARARHREQVQATWRMRPGGGRGGGVLGLFAGASGTGKTMAAEVVAGSLGVELYAVDLATVVDKYIGETEKNLSRVFDAAERVSGLLLFDEADALFGRRSEVRDARDRYANIEVAYLLQRMESFSGVALLATNLVSNVDDAFARRLDAVVEFPLPDPAARRQIWLRCLRPPLPVADDVDVDFLAERFGLAGGDIRSTALTAAYTAAAAGGPVSMPLLVQAVAQEYRKLGRLCLEHEFGEWWDLIQP